MFRRALPKMRMMDNVSRPLIALLAATVAFFALYIVALRARQERDSAGTSRSDSRGYQSDIARPRSTRRRLRRQRCRQRRWQRRPTSRRRTRACARPQLGELQRREGRGQQLNGELKQRLDEREQHERHSGPRSTVTSTHNHVGDHSTTERGDARARRRKKVLALLFYNPAARR